MLIDKIIKRQIIGIIATILIISTVFIGLSFSSFFSVDEGEELVINVGDLDVTFCKDVTCGEAYSNYGKVIGLQTVDGVSVPSAIYPYETTALALESTPYIFNVKNTGDVKVYFNAFLEEDTDFVPSGNYSSYTSVTQLYSDYVKVGLSECANGNINTSDVDVFTFGNIVGGKIIDNLEMNKNDEKTYCVWTWLDKSAPNEVQETYFVANLNFTAEYVPAEPVPKWYDTCTASSNNLNCKIITAQTPSSDENIDFAYTSEGKSMDSSYNELSDSTQITNGLYYTSNLNLTEDYDGDGTGDRVYYYRGAVENNNVVFGEFANDEEYYIGYKSSAAEVYRSYPTLESCQSSSYNYNCEKVTVAKKGKKMCWRIVRTNEDGSVRLRYNGEYSNGTCPTTGTEVKINNSYYEFYGSWDDEKYNEYIWEDGTGESLAKTTIDAWYTSSGLSNYEDQIANVPYCADKSNPTNDFDGYTYYGAANRLADITTYSVKSDAQPTYKCERTVDKHTVSGDTWGGNGKLSKPIGLLTADEVAFAGGVLVDNTSYYLFTSSNYWLISPFYLAGFEAYSSFVDSTGGLNFDNVTYVIGLLPAVSLKAETMVKAQGDGTYTNPYVVAITV